MGITTMEVSSNWGTRVQKKNSGFTIKPISHCLTIIFTMQLDATWGYDVVSDTPKMSM